MREKIIANGSQFHGVGLFRMNDKVELGSTFDLCATFSFHSAIDSVFLRS